MVVDSRAFRTITVGCRRCCSVDRGRVARVSVRSMRCRRCGCDRGSVDRGRPLLCGIRRRALWFGRRGIALISRFVFAVEQSDPNWRTTANIRGVPTPPLRSSRRERLGRRDERIQASRRLQGPRGRRARCVQTPHRTRTATHPRLFDGISATPERSFSSATPHPPSERTKR